MTDLLLRINAILRRTKIRHHSNSISFRDIHLDLKSRTVTIESNEIELSKLEFNLLHTMVVNEESALKRDFLLKQVWGKNENYQGCTVNVVINHSKEKNDPKKQKKYIRTIRGIGYSIH